MARTARVTASDVPMHVMQRGNNRSRVFADAADQFLYRKAMFASARICGCAVHAYVLMSNHVHILLTPSQADSAASMMRRLGAVYVRQFNDRHQRTGTLWEGRFRSVLIDSERYFFACSRYIELNPVRAGMVQDPAVYPWSSFRHNALGRAEPLLTPHYLYTALAESPRARRSAYRALFADPLDAETFEVLRGSGIAGGGEFRERVLAANPGTALPRRHGGDRKSKVFRGSPGQ